jgi:hypothetical protein
MSKDFMEGHDYMSSEGVPSHYGSLFLQLMRLNTVAAGKKQQEHLFLMAFS